MILNFLLNSVLYLKFYCPLKHNAILQAKRKIGFKFEPMQETNLKILQKLQEGNIKALSRMISLVENDDLEILGMMANLPFSSTQITGITGPPGAGKSTLTDGLIEAFVADGKKVGVLCIDPSSPFNMGALLGDRIRMSQWYNHPDVYIRSLATRGSLGGLNPKIIEITDIMKTAPFDHIIIETVGVGQSEIEIAGLADITVVVIVPEAGDEVQTMKAGLMEVADIFVVNKADRPGADIFIKNLRLMLAPAFHRTQQPIPILKTVASQKQGIWELYESIEKHENQQAPEKKSRLLAEKAYQFILQKRMKDIDKKKLAEQIQKTPEGDFNLYRFIEQYY